MLDARKHAPPITAVESLVNDATDFEINTIPGQNLVIYLTQQFQQSALIPHIRICMVLRQLGERVRCSTEMVFVIAPLLRLVSKLVLALTFVVHVRTPNTFRL